MFGPPGRQGRPNSKSGLQDKRPHHPFSASWIETRSESSTKDVHPQKSRGSPTWRLIPQSLACLRPNQVPIANPVRCFVLYFVLSQGTRWQQVPVIPGLFSHLQTSVPSCSYARIPYPPPGQTKTAAPFDFCGSAG